MVNRVECNNAVVKNLNILYTCVYSITICPEKKKENKRQHILEANHKCNSVIRFTLPYINPDPSMSSVHVYKS